MKEGKIHLTGNASGAVRVLTVKSVQSDYREVEINPPLVANGKSHIANRYYEDRAKAKAYLASLSH